MKLKCVALSVLLLGMIGCGGQDARESDAKRMLASARDLEEEFADLPQAIARYGEIAAQFPHTEAAEQARARRAILERAQTRLAGREAVPKDSTEAFYEAVVEVAPDYFAALKKLGTIYYNQTHLNALWAVKTESVPMKEQVAAIWEKQNRMWSRYAFRPMPSDRFWRDQLCKHALSATKMLIDNAFRDYGLAQKIITQGLAYAASKDVMSQAKVYAAECAFWQGKTEDFQQGIALAEEALSYQFLSDTDRALAYHVIGKCYTYIHQNSGDRAHLDEAIKALNEAVNINGDMRAARQLLKVLRQQREKLAAQAS